MGGGDLAIKFECLLSPLKIREKTIKNRVLVTAHIPGVEQNQLINDEYIAYQQAKARGGAGLQISGITAILIDKKYQPLSAIL